MRNSFPDEKTFYMLDPTGKPIPAANITVWAEWYMKNLHHYHLRRDEFPDGSYVSTVFLGVRANLLDDAPPLLWETIISGGPHHQYQERYATRADAIAGHEMAVKLAEGKCRR